MKLKQKRPEESDLRVLHFPQVPCDPFEVDVPSIEVAGLVMDILGDYDRFQLDNNIKPDYANATLLVRMEDGEWCDWYDEETGMDIDEFREAKAGKSHA